MATSNSNAARISEGLTAEEAEYFASGGNKELTPPVENADAGAGDAGASPAPGAADPNQPPAAAQTQPQAQQPPPADPNAAEDDDDDRPSDPNASIPYQKYARERARLRKQLAERDERINAQGTQLSALQQQWARLDERFRMFQEVAPQPQATQPAAPPDPETDPFGYMKWLGERVAGIQGQTEQVVNQTQEQQAYQALTQTFQGDARQFAQSTPDFLESAPGARDGAYHFLMKSRDAELQAAGYTDPQERLRIIALDERDIVARALHAKQQNPQAPGPAAVLYQLAKARGFTGRAPAAAAAPTNGSAARPAAPAAPAAAPSVTQQVEAIARGQAASRSLSAGGGAPVPQGIDLASLAQMDDAQYMAWKAALSPAQRKEFHAMIGAPGR